MSKMLRFTAIVATLTLSGMSIAQTTTAMNKTTTVSKTKPLIGPTKATVTTKTDAATTAATADGHKVTTKTSTGKTITYDCSKAGNKTKAACKGK